MWPFKKKTQPQSSESPVMSARQAHEVADKAFEASIAEDVRKLERKVRRAIWRNSQKARYVARLVIDDGTSNSIYDFYLTEPYVYSSEVRDTVKRILESDGYVVTDYVADGRYDCWQITW